MSSMVSIILVFMLTIGGSPVVPGNSVDSFNISEKSLLGAKKISPGVSIKKITDNHHPIKEKRNLNLKLSLEFHFGYNKVHMKKYEQRLHEIGRGNVMAYDELYRLTNMKFNVPDPTVENPTTFEKEKAIKFDKLDNILSIVENYNDQTKTITTDIPENSTYSKLNQYYSFDKWGLGYDKKGNTTQRGTQQLAYNYRNQLVTAADAPSNTQVEIKYDVLGRRIQKSVTIGSQTKIENYYHSGQQVIEVRDENDQLLRQYIYGNGIDEIIRMDKYEGDTFTSYYYHTDASGSVTAITDTNGQLVERVTYDIYGMPTFWDAAGNKISKSSIGNNILFHGREYDTELNLYYFRARYYCPIMGRFLQTDPMGYQDSMNLYQSFNMNPVNFIDPFGESIREILDIQFAYYEYLMDVKGWSEEAAHQEARKQSRILIKRWKMSLEMKQVLTDLSMERFRKRLYVGAPIANLGELELIYDCIKNFGTATGEAISNWLMHKDFEHFLIMATTAWGEAGAAFLAVLGGLKGYQGLKAQYQSIQSLDARFESFVKGKYGQYKDWYSRNKPRLIRGSIGLSKIEERLQKVVVKYGGVKVEGGYKFSNKRSAKQAASELLGNMGSDVETLYVKDYGGAPWNLRKSNKIYGKTSKNKSKEWRDDFIGHSSFGENRPHISISIDGYKYHFYY